MLKIRVVRYGKKKGNASNREKDGDDAWFWPWDFALGYIPFVNIVNICMRTSLRYFFYFSLQCHTSPERVVHLWLTFRIAGFQFWVHLFHSVLGIFFIEFSVPLCLPLKSTSSSIKMSNFLPLLGYFAHWNHFYEAQAAQHNLTILPRKKKIKEA